MAPHGPLCQVRAPTPGHGGRPRCRGVAGAQRPGGARYAAGRAPGVRRLRRARGAPSRIGYPEPGQAPPPPFLFVARPPQAQGTLRATPASHRESRRWSRAASARAPQPPQEPGETRRSELLSPAAPGLPGPPHCAQAPGAPRRAERGGRGPRAPPAPPTWIRGSTSSSSASPGSIPASSSSSSSESRAGGGRSAGPSGRFRLGAASMPGAARDARGWRPRSRRSLLVTAGRGSWAPLAAAGPRAPEEVGAVAPSPPRPSAPPAPPPARPAQPRLGPAARGTALRHKTSPPASP